MTAAPDEPDEPDESREPDAEPDGRGQHDEHDEHEHGEGEHGEPAPSEASPPGDPLWTADPVGLGMLDDSALQSELAALLPLADRDALKDPLTLAMHLDRRVVSRPHLRVIAAALAGLSPNGGERVLVTTPPQVGKTQLAQWGLFWWLCRHPSARVIIGSYGTQLATKRGRAIRKLVTLYGQRYGLAIDPGQGAAGDWRLTSGGGCRSAGLNAGITGEPADLALIDDPVRGRVDADSPTKREHAWNWWSGDLTSRLAPGAPVLLVMTRWHDDDVAARLLAEEGRVEDGGRWRVVHMPAIAVPADPDRGIAPDGLGRKPGEPLSHPRIATSDRVQLLRHWEDKRRGSTARDWGALYQGDPKPVEGALIDRAVLRERHCFSPTAVPIKHAVAIDPSGGGRDTAGIVAGWLGDDRKVYLSHDLSGHMPTEQWSETACRLAFSTQADRLLVEANYGGDMARRVLRSAWQDLVARGEIPATVLPPQVVMIHARKGKMLRAEPIAHQIQLDNVRFTQALPELEEEWATWQPNSSESPGRIDASVHLVLDLLPMASAGGHRGPFSSAAGVSRAGATGHGDAGMPRLPRDPARRNVVVFDPSRYNPRRPRRSA